MKSTERRRGFPYKLKAGNHETATEHVNALTVSRVDAKTPPPFSC